MRIRGFTLIELMIAVALFAILVLLALPTYTSFMANTQIRNAAENSLSGVRLAQASAIKSNRLAKFVLGTTGWAVYAWDEDSADFAVEPVQSYQFAEGASQTTVTPPSGKVTFDGLGRVFPDAASLTRVDITNSHIANPRDLSIVISLVGGNIKLCDPAVVDTTDPRLCP